MKTSKLIKLYKENAEKNSPDMDHIWERIEGSLGPKPENAVTSKPMPKKMTFRKPTVWATVCAAALIILPISVRIINNSQDMTSNESMSMDAAPETQAVTETQALTTAFPEYTEAADNEFNEEEFNEAVVEEAEPSNGMYFAGSVPTEAISENEYFIEENVLIQTDVIVNAYIDRVYSKGNSTCYEISAENAETGEPESITLETDSIYTMKQDGNYILPLKSSENGSYSLAFENAPQIEETENGGLLFHNGWISLDENSTPTEYPQVSVDDFFYDRMRYSYSGDISPLLEKWHEVKQE